VTGLVVRNVVRSQRVVAPALLTLAAAVLVCSNGPQRPGETLGATVAVLLPVHAWTGLTTASGTDDATREAFTAIAGAVRVFLAHLAAAAVIAAVATAFVVGAALTTGVMDGSPTGTQWWAFAAAASASIALGVAIGTVAGPPVIGARGTRVVVALGLVTVALIASPLLAAARRLGRAAPADVLGPTFLFAAATAGIAAALVLAGAVVAARR
jgi:hypothetical protein